MPPLSRLVVLAIATSTSTDWLSSVASFDGFLTDDQDPEKAIFGKLLYLANCTRPDITYAVAQLSRALVKPTPELMRATDRILVYLSRHRELGLTYDAKPATDPSTFADASWETRHSTSGWVIFYQTAAISYGSTKQKSIALSSCEAEIIALSEATKDTIFVRKLVAGLEGAPLSNPTAVHTDSKSGRDVSFNPEHFGRMKHVERRHFFVRDMVEKMEVTVPLVKTTENWADFFTKPLKCRAQFFAMRDVIMNVARSNETTA